MFNKLLTYTPTLEEGIDIEFEAKNTLRSLSSYARKCNDELNQQQFSTHLTKGASSAHFALYTLKLSLIALYFDVQETYKEHLPQVLSQDDFYQFCLEEIAPDQPALKLTDAFHVKEAAKAQQLTAPKFSFGF